MLDAGRGDDCADTARDFIKGKTIKEIARDLKVSRNTVRSYGAGDAQSNGFGARAYKLYDGKGSYS
jgi:predicted transcriptional regulator